MHVTRQVISVRVDSSFKRQKIWLTVGISSHDEEEEAEKQATTEALKNSSMAITDTRGRHADTHTGTHISSSDKHWELDTLEPTFSTEEFTEEDF